MAKQRKSQQEIRERITAQMIDALAKGTPPWRKPWSAGPNAGAPRNFQSNHRYSGINPLMLMWASMAEGWDSCCWGSSHAWSKNLHAHVRKGEKATRVIFYFMIDQKDNSGAPMLDGKGRQKKFPLLREFPVFNADQMQAPELEVLLDGRCQKGKRGSYVRNILAPKSTAARTKAATVKELQAMVKAIVPKKSQPEKLPSLREPLAQLICDSIQAKLDKYRVVVPETDHPEPDFEPAEVFIAATEAKITHKGSRACYRPSTDTITLPPKARFATMSDYYETAFHELVHWTQPKKRVGEVEGHQYAFGELVAEIGACFLMMEIGVPMPDTMMEHSQSYVKSWLKGMNSGEKGEGPKFIFDAATQAGKSVDYLLAFVGRENPASDSARAA